MYWPDFSLKLERGFEFELRSRIFVVDFTHMIVLRANTIFWKNKKIIYSKWATTATAAVTAKWPPILGTSFGTFTKYSKCKVRPALVKARAETGDFFKLNFREKCERWPRATWQEWRWTSAHYLMPMKSGIWTMTSTYFSSLKLPACHKDLRLSTHFFILAPASLGLHPYFVANEMFRARGNSFSK